MLDNINENKLLFLDIETTGTYATLEEMEQNNKTLFQLWYNTTLRTLDYPVQNYSRNTQHYYQNLVGLFVLVLGFYLKVVKRSYSHLVKVQKKIY